MVRTARGCCGTHVVSLSGGGWSAIGAGRRPGDSEVQKMSQQNARTPVLRRRHGGEQSSRLQMLWQEDARTLHCFSDDAWGLRPASMGISVDV